MTLKRLLPARLKHALVRTFVMPYVRRFEQQRLEKERRRSESRVPHWSRSERPGPKQTVRIGFVGAGQYARHHLRVLASYEAVELAALLTTGGPAAAEIAPQFGIERLFSDLGAFLAQDDLDCFVVVVPPRVMVEVASQCLATGKPVLLEKPPGVASTDTQTLIRVAGEAGTWGMVGLNRRFYSVVEHGLAALGKLGAVRGAILEVPQGITADRQSGRLTAFDYDHFYVRNSIHDVDLLRYVLGDPIRVHSRAWSNAEFGNRAASFAAILEFGQGVTATVLDLWDTPDEARFKVVAEGGAVRWEKMRKGWVEAAGDPLPIPVDPVDERFRAGLWAQDLHFVEAVRSGREPALPGATLKDALGTMVLIERILGDSLGDAAALEDADPAPASDPVPRAVLQPD
jgi:predicted dehydrogenase